MTEQTRHQQIITMYQDESVKPSAVLKHFGISRQRLHQHLDRAGVPSRVTVAKKRIEACMAGKTSVKAVAECAGCSVDTVQRVLRKRADYATVAQGMKDARKAESLSERQARMNAMLDQLRALAKELKRTPSLREALQQEIPVRAWLNAAGGYTKLVEAAGLAPNWKGNT